jgi:hypothetical protein
MKLSQTAPPAEKYVAAKVYTDGSSGDSGVIGRSVDRFDKRLKFLWVRFEWSAARFASMAESHPGGVSGPRLRHACATAR